MSKKFKIKNRKKRSYIKRGSPISMISLSQSTMIKFMPYALITIGMITTLFIDPHPWNEVEPISISIRKPALSINDILRTPEDIPTLITTATLQLATSIVSTIKILNSLGLAMWNQAIVIGKDGSAFIFQLFWLTITISQVSSNFTLGIISHTISFMSYIIHLVSQVATFIGQGITAFLLLLLHELISIVQFISHICIEAINTLVNILQAIGNSIIVTVAIIMQKISAAINALWYLLMTPFRIMQPYINYVINNFKDSTQFLVTSMTALQ